MATLAEKMALVRAQALEVMALPEDAKQVGPTEYAFKVEAGMVKVKFTAVKDAEFDLDEMAQEYADEVALKADEKKTRLAKKEADKNADLAKKARAKAAKEAAKNG